MKKNTSFQQKNKPLSISKALEIVEKNKNTWKNISSEFTIDLQREWEDKGFSYKECKEWTKMGLKPKDYNYAHWLSKIEEYVPEEVLENNSEERLRNRYNNYLESLETKDEDYDDYFDHSEYYEWSWQETKLQNAQEYLDENYTNNLSKKKIADIKELDISDKGLEGSLKIENFPNLEELKCSSNQITSLETINCPKLTKIICYGNLLESLDFLNNLNLEKTIELHLSNNNFSKQDLSVFSCFINLKRLDISNGSKQRLDGSYKYESDRREDIYNRFIGSLKPLENLTKLESLEIWNTDIDSGLEYLPNSLKSFRLFDFTWNLKKDARFNKLLELLEPYKNRTWEVYDLYDVDHYEYDLEKWRKNNLLSSQERKKINEEEIRREGFVEWLFNDSFDWESIERERKSDDKKWKEITTEVEKMNSHLRHKEGNNKKKEEHIEENISDSDDYSSEEDDDIVYRERGTQEWLEENYPEKVWFWESLIGRGRSSVRKLSLNKKKLKGELDLSDFVNLKELDCDDNQLVDIKLLKSSFYFFLQKRGIYYDNLTYLSCNNNQLTSTDFLKEIPYPQRLTHLYISDNNFTEQDLSFLKPFTGLEELWIGNHSKSRVTKGSYNRFYGSLEPLLRMMQLGSLNISFTNINDDLEYLPEELEIIYCKGCKKIEKQLKEYYEREKGEKQTDFSRRFDFLEREEKLFDDGNKFKKAYNFRAWREDNEVMINEKYSPAQRWLDTNYPKEVREEITELDIGRFNLKGKLKLEGFVNLRKLYCINIPYLEARKNNKDETKCDKLTGLDLSECYSLELLCCSYNAYIDINFLQTIPHLEKLKSLDISINLSQILGTTKVYAYHYSSETPKEWKSLKNAGELKLRTYFSNLEELTLRPDSGVRNQFTSLTLRQKRRRNFRKRIEKNQLIIVEENTRKALLSQFEELNSKSNCAISQKELKRIIENKVIVKGEIIDAQFFSTWFNPNCVIVINRNNFYKAIYTVILVIYEPPYKKMEEVIKVKKFPGTIGWYLTLGEAKVKVEEVKKELNGDNPILAVSRTTFYPANTMERIYLPTTEFNPDDHLKPLDIIWRRVSWTPSYHVSIYLGGKRVAHVSSLAREEAENKKKKKSFSKKNFGAIISDWQDFLKETGGELIRYRAAIPFKRPEKIIEHIKKAVSVEYGKDEYNLLTENCEHFASLCVCGFTFSTQVDKAAFFIPDKIDIAKEISENDKMFGLIELDKENDENNSDIQLLNKAPEMKTIGIGKVENMKSGESKQLQPTNWKNINSNFTPELVQQWINHGFTYEECADWVNINSPARQNIAIHEPTYYAWLRDVKKVDSDWVHNYGNSEQLKQEYQEYLQQQYQTQTEIPSKK